MTEGTRQLLEVDLLVKAIHECYGYDFSSYSKASLIRRIAGLTRDESLKNISQFTERIIHSPEFFSKIFDKLTITVTEMFRDPEVYEVLREQVFPYLSTYPELKVWHAGCSSGEEAYSVAILLHEAGLFSRTLSYGTDINKRALIKAREGVVRFEDLVEADPRYKRAGGTGRLQDYFLTEYGLALLRSDLRNRLVFSDHNLVTDGKFGEMNLILCRNVLIYFDTDLQRRVMDLLWKSLAVGGYLCLGSKERIDCRSDFIGCQVVDGPTRIFQKKA